MHKAFLQAIERESQERGCTEIDVLMELRDTIRGLVMQRARSAPEA